MGIKSFGGNKNQFRSFFARALKFDSTGFPRPLPPPPPITSSGGTAYNGTPIGVVHKFTSTSQNFAINDPGGSAPTVDCTLLVVGGGGAGGSFEPGAYGGGGGGAGGVRYIPSITLLANVNYECACGGGGGGGNPYTTPNVGGPAAQPRGGGTSSVFNLPGGNGIPAITATGGGGGGQTGSAGGAGGSGGGKSYPGNGGSGNAGGTEPRANPTSEGNSAQNNKSGGSNYQCGGGGGANPSPSTLPFQKGSPGVTLPGVGSPGDPWLPPAGNVFGGGGGGSSYKESEGNGGGGPGGGGNAPGAAATEYTGGGGGGAGSPSGSGGDGGDGIIYVVIPTSYNVTGSPG